MKLVGIAMVRDEADVIGYTLDHLKHQGVDEFVILDNGSTDGTRSQLYRGGMTTVLDDPEPGYYQDRKMSELAARAFEMGATWVLPFDADELWFSPAGTIADALAGVPGDRTVVSAVEYKHWPTPWDMPGDPNPLTRLAFREEQPHRLHKVCFRAHPDPHVHMGNHGVNLGPYNPDRPDPALELLELRHFPYRSFDQFVRKVRNGRQAYENATEVNQTTVAGHEMTGTHWKQMGAYTDEQLHEAWADATCGYACSHQWLGHGDLTKDPAPWCM